MYSPNLKVNRDLHWFWTNKLNHLEAQGMIRSTVAGLAMAKRRVVDVSLAIDLIQATYEKRYEVAIIVSKDSDFGPAVALAKVIAESQGRKLVFQSAFPVALNTPKKQMRGVPGTQWIPIDQADYDTCRDWNGVPSTQS